MFDPSLHAIFVPRRPDAHTPFVSRDGSRQMCQAQIIARDPVSGWNHLIPLTSRMILADKLRNLRGPHIGEKTYS
jgi:hypothetical protein